MSLANISVVGNLVKDPEQVQFDSGNIKTNVLVAVNHAVQQGKENTADFYRVELWGKLGDLACKYLHKGNQVAVSGRFQLDRWQDREGKERVTPVISASQLSLPPRLRVVGADEVRGTAEDNSEATAMVAEESATYEFGSGSYVREDDFAEDALGSEDTLSNAHNNIDADDEFPKRAPPAGMRTRSAAVAAL